MRRYLACPSYSSSWLPEPSPSLHRHTSGTGISTRRPSATPFGLALGPDYPREDEPSSGDLGPSVRGILTHVPLLTPAFSLPCAPHAIPVMLLRCMQCSPTTFLSIASVSCLAPVNYRRRVIRLVSCYALFEGWLLLSRQLLVVCTSPLPFPLSMHFGTLADGLGCFPLDDGPYHSPSDCRR